MCFEVYTYMPYTSCPPFPPAAELPGVEALHLNTIICHFMTRYLVNYTILDESHSYKNLFMYIYFRYEPSALDSIDELNLQFNYEG